MQLAIEETEDAETEAAAESTIIPNLQGSTAILPPWSDNFEDGIKDWTIVNFGDVTQGWVLANQSSISKLHPASFGGIIISEGTQGRFFMFHGDDRVPGFVDNSLVSPLLDLTSLNDPFLSYDEGTYDSNFYFYHGVLTSVDFDGTNAKLANWEEIASGVDEDWLEGNAFNTRKYPINNLVTGIAFNYKGSNASMWFLDNVSVSEANMVDNSIGGNGRE